MKILVTGGAGFIGANFVHYWRKTHPEDHITVLDKLTYAGNLSSLASVFNDITFIEGDIIDEAVVKSAMTGQDCVVHFAAETHVDRSIHNPYVFTDTNAKGTHVLLETARQLNIPRFHHVSTDEVFGHIPLDEDWKFNEDSNYKPNSPYSASKSASDHLVRSYFITYGLPITISNCSNNFGPFMHPEKFIPRSIIRLMKGENIRLYTPGNQVRDWLYVEDHCRAIDMILHHGKLGDTYCVGGMAKGINNSQVAREILQIMGLPESRIELVTDRPGHDQKYDIDWSKINRELGWSPKHTFGEWLRSTVSWYIQNENWWKPLAEESEAFYTSRGEKVVPMINKMDIHSPAPHTDATADLTYQLLQAQASAEVAIMETGTTETNLPKTPTSIPTIPATPPQAQAMSDPATVQAATIGKTKENDYIIETDIPGLMIIERPTYSDDRGFFRETFRKEHLEQRYGSPIEFMQANHSRSSKGTLRGIHIAPWHKLITVTSGEVQAVIVDTRPFSPTFGKYLSINLSDKYPRSLFVPEGCGNSFLVLSETADYIYNASAYWAPGLESNVAFDDPFLNIPWTNPEPILSDRDKANPTLREAFPEKF